MWKGKDILSIRIVHLTETYWVHPSPFKGRMEIFKKVYLLPTFWKSNRLGFGWKEAIYCQKIWLTESEKKMY